MTDAAIRIAIGADDAALALKTAIMAHLDRQLSVPVTVADLGLHEHQITDNGPDRDYPEIAEAVAGAVLDGRADRGVLLCGTGIGVAIVANKMPGIRAACCHDVYSAERARKSNDAQILTMGARVIAPQLACMVLDAWLGADFAGGQSRRKLDKIEDLERRVSQPRDGGAPGRPCEQDE